MFTNGLQGPYPMQQPVFNSRGINVGGGGGGGIGGGGGGGDSGLPQMWNQGIKAGPNDAGDSEVASIISKSILFRNLAKSTKSIILFL